MNLVPEGRSPSSSTTRGNRDRSAHAPRRALSWARQVIADQGVEVCDGLVAVYGSQADISAACGFARNDGRVYAYLRGLAAGGVARCDRGVVLFDPQRLELMERALVVRRLTPRAMEVAGILGQQFGRPAADGTVTLERDSGQNSGPPTPPRLADMGDALSMTRSSAQRHVSSLRSHGYLVGGRWRGGPLRLVPDGGPEPGQVVWQLVNAQAELVRLLSLAHTLRDEEQCLRDAIDGGDGPAEGGPAAALSQLAETQAALIDAFSAAHGLRDQIDSLYRLLAGSAPSAPTLRAEKGAERGAEGAVSSAERGADQEEKIRKDMQSSSLFSSHRGAESPGQGAGATARNGARTAAEDAGSQTASAAERPGGDGWDAVELPLMCTDLVDACQANGLQGANNWPGLVQALGAYTKDQVVAAQRALANDVMSKRPITNPFGLLAKVAAPEHPRHMSYFRPVRTEPLLRRPSPIDQPDEVDDDDLEDYDRRAAEAVAALEASGASDELAALDDHARAHTFQFAPLVFESLSEPARCRARAKAWRALHPLPSPTVLEQGKDQL